LGNYTPEEALRLTWSKLVNTTASDALHLLLDYLHENYGHGEHAQKVLEVWMHGVICQPIAHGDFFDAESTNDPLFWVTHGTIDRAWHYVRLSKTFGDVFDFHWPESHPCYGHNPKDLLDFDPSMANSSIVPDGVKYIKQTNEEWLGLLSPHNQDLPYIYESFSWPHCTDRGFHMINDFGTGETSETSSAYGMSATLPQATSDEAAAPSEGLVSSPTSDESATRSGSG